MFKKFPLLIILLPGFLFLFVVAGCKNSLPGEDSLTRIDKTNQQPQKQIQDNCTDKCHKRGTFMDPILINGEGTQGKHKKHVEERGMYCTICHYNYASMESHRNNILDTNNPEVRIVYFDPINWNPEDDRRGEWAEDQGVVSGAQTGGCASLYCHGKREADIGIPRWYEDVTFECTYCHTPGAPIDPTSNYERFPAEKHPEGFVYSGEACTSCHPSYLTSQLVPANAHPRHVDDVGFPCEMCHYNYKERATHANGVLDSAKEVPQKINFNPVLNKNGWYDGTTKTCNNLYCHGNDFSPISQGADTTPVWTDLATGDCGNCHKADPTHSQGSHSRHLNPPYSFPCYKCHFDNRGAPRENGSVVTRQDHHVKEAMPLNGVVNVIFDKSTLPANPTGIFNSTNKTCSSLYCHGSKLPEGSNGTSTTPTWGDRIEPWCGTCHDVDIHDSSPLTSRSSGRHTLHLADGTGSSPKNGPRIQDCTRCHPGSFSGIPEDSRTYDHVATHVNGVISYTDSTPLGIENLWGDPQATGWSLIDWTLDDGKTCVSSGCHTQQPPQSLDFVHSDLKKRASYNTSIDPDASADATGTAVCDSCHSPGGDYDGVADPIIGAKFNWLEGVYISGTGEDFTDVNQTVLKVGEEKWCAGCHDKDPSRVITKEFPTPGITAPAVIGDETAPSNYGTGWGFYKTGHGVPTTQTMPWTGTKANREATGTWSTDGRPGPGKACTRCHNPTLYHIDGENRTFDCSDGQLCTPDDYQSGYRLRKVATFNPMEIPKTDGAAFADTDARLCFQCHESTRFTNNGNAGGYVRETNFWTSLNNNGHYYHLNLWALVDVDWRYSSTDTRPVCITCHNVHGSNQLAMVRNGWLTGGRMIKINYKDAFTTTINTNTNPCHNLEILDSSSDKGVLLDDSDGSVFCGDVWSPTGSGICSVACHMAISEINRTPLPLTFPK